MRLVGVEEEDRRESAIPLLYCTRVDSGASYEERPDSTDLNGADEVC